MARLVAIGDAHLGRSHLAHLRDSEGRNLREEDFLRSFAWAIDRTIELEPDGFVWLGDIFDHARPTYRTFAHVLADLQRLADASLHGVAISGNHDTPRVRGTGSPYDALERVFANVAFAWRMEAMHAEIAGVHVHAVPQTLGVEELREQLKGAGEAVVPGLDRHLLLRRLAGDRQGAGRDRYGRRNGRAHRESERAAARHGVRGRRRHVLGRARRRGRARREGHPGGRRRARIPQRGRPRVVPAGRAGAVPGGGAGRAVGAGRAGDGRR